MNMASGRFIVSKLYGKYDNGREKLQTWGEFCIYFNFWCNFPALRLNFGCKSKLEFHGTKVTSGAG